MDQTDSEKLQSQIDQLNATLKQMKETVNSMVARLVVIDDWIAQTSRRHELMLNIMTRMEASLPKA